MATQSPLESTITKKILKALNAIEHCHAIKVHGNSYSSGQPDIDGALLLYVNPTTGLPITQSFKFECKRPGEKPTALQASVMRQWGAVGVCVAVVTSVEEALAALAPYLRLREEVARVEAAAPTLTQRFAEEIERVLSDQSTPATGLIGAPQ